ncbi:MAG TPA: SMC family ATPase [Fimbriimonadales bacterium]|nr:SMC family ATPase [Fimbriimonadales bacterium]
MLLKELKLQNFRQYREESIEFHPGITAIVGENGSGKTTLLEAMIWCLYGEARDSNKTIPNKWSKGDEPTLVELRFVLDGREFTVIRELRKSNSKATVLDAEGKCLAASPTEVNRFVENRLLRMTYEQFRNSFCTEQKQLDFLNFRSHSDKKDEIAKMLGYTRLRKAQELAKEKAKEAKNKIEGSEAFLSIAQNYEKEKKDAEAEYLDAKKKREAVEKEFQDISTKLKDFSSRVEAAKEVIEIDKELAQRKELEERLKKDLLQSEGEIKALEKKKEERDNLKPDAEKYEALKGELDSLLKKQKEFQKRAITQSRMERAEVDLADTRKRLKELEPLLLAKVVKEFQETKNRISQLEQEIELFEKKWQKEKEKARRLFDRKHQELDNLQKEQKRLDESVKEGKCPTCGQKLKEGRLPRALELEEQISKIAEEYRSLKKDLECIEKEPEEYKTKKADLEKEKKKLQTLDEQRLEETKKDNTAKELRNKEKELVNEIESLRKQIEKYPPAFDENRIQAVQEEMKELQPKWRNYMENANIEQQLESLEKKFYTMQKELEAEKQKREEKIKRQKDLGMNKAEAEQVLSKQEEMKKEYETIQLKMTDAKAKEKAEKDRLERAVEQMKKYEERKKEVEEWKKQRTLYTEIARAFDGLYGILALRTRELLEEFASEFINTLSEGRYTSLELNDRYEPVLKDDGIGKEVISGGETDLVNLSLRLALANLIQENSGHAMSLLILDEVFGSLDNIRRDSVMRQLNALRERFEQILVISHIDAINDAADRSLIVTFDPEEHVSKIEEKIATAMLL